MSLTQKEIIISILNGFLIGIANLIPGVSGGTFALILGLYDRLLSAITGLNARNLLGLWRLLRGSFRAETRRELVQEIQRLDLVFLALLGIGLLASVLSGAKLIQYLLAYHPSPTLALFIGLILPSLTVPYKLMGDHHWKAWIFFPFGILVTFLPTLLMGEFSGSDHPLFGFLTGMIAISAMILPGISGSYIMLVLGEYQIIIGKLSSITAAGSLGFLVSFGLGCLVGLWAFTHIVKWLLDHHKAKTMAFLIGLIVGSFFILWPFKDFEHGQAVTGRKAEIKRDIQIATAKNQIPDWSPEVGLSLATAFLGLGLGLGLNRLEEVLAPKDSPPSV